MMTNYAYLTIVIFCMLFIFGECSSKPHIVFIVADDLGYNDLGFLNGGKTITPVIDSLVQNGIFLTDYYTYKVCAPSRASLMTGRYPWGVGFYDMSDDTNHCVNKSTQLLPEVLNRYGYVSHAIGKWDVGYIFQSCTPTFRGFQSFIGYYTPCTADYWYHGSPGNNWTYSVCDGVDFSNNTAFHIQGADMRGHHSVNGTYDRTVFSDRAVDIIAQHDPSRSLFLYLAFHNVHDACTRDRFALGLNAPKATVDLYATQKLDTWKVQAAMTTELDYGVGHVTAALKARGMWDNTLLVFVSDNGGPLDHSSNFPFRDGKGSWFEGGVRVVAFVSGGVVPPERRGTRWNGMAHSSDWYVTFVEGIANGSLQGTGPRIPDGKNLRDALFTNRSSPRTEVIHGVNGSDVIPPLPPGACTSCRQTAARFGDYKVIFNVYHGREHVSWPDPVDHAVPFGESGGQIEQGTDHYRAPLLKEEGPVGIRSHHGIFLFHLPTDPGETNNLATNPRYAPLIEQFRNRLKEAAATGPLPAHYYPPNWKTQLCSIAEKGGFLEPVDYSPANS